MMETVILVIGIYLLTGVVALTILDMLTHRIRTRLKGASYESQSKLADRGVAVSQKAAMVLTVIALWLFWPAAIIGAVKSS